MAFIKCSGGDGSKSKAGYIQGSTTSTTIVTLGWRPLYLAIMIFSTGNNSHCCFYHKTWENTTGKINYAIMGESYSNVKQMPYTANNTLNNITDDGFIVNKIASASWPGYYYIALGDNFEN